jgi:hypothetical protein
MPDTRKPADMSQEQWEFLALSEKRTINLPAGTPPDEWLRTRNDIKAWREGRPFRLTVDGEEPMAIEVTDQSLLDLLHNLGGPLHHAPYTMAVSADVARRIESVRQPGDTDEEALKRTIREAW